MNTVSWPIRRLAERLLRLTLAVALLFSALVWLPPVLAQGGTITIDQVDPSQHPNMTVLASVRDVNGVPIPDLGRNAFEIVEDGQTSFPPDEVTTQVNPDAVVSIALVIDLSGSMRGKPLQEAQAASANLLDALLNLPNDPDRVAFFGINRQVAPDDLAYDSAVEIPFSNDKNQALNVINFLAIEGSRPTPLYDALFRVVKLTSGQSGRRAIIVITDGIDQVSQLKADDPIIEANRHNIPIFPISLSTNRVDEDFLQRLAVRTGGQYRKAPQPEEFTGLFQQVLDQLKLQYKLSYQSRLKEDNGIHSVLVRVRSPQASGFDEKKFKFSDVPPTPAPPSGVIGAITTQLPVAVTLEPIPTATAEPAVAAEEETLIDEVGDFIADNPLPAALIGLALLLLVVLIILLIVWWRRKSGSAAYGEAPLVPDEWAAGGFAAPATQVDMASTGGPSTTGGIAPTTAQSTGPAPSPFQPAPGFAPAPPPVAAPVVPPAGGTRVLQRTPEHSALLVSRKDASRRHDLLADTTIGRSQDNTLVISDPTVSRQHARVRLEKAQFLLFDLGSANGTFVNDQRVEAPVALADGDIVRFGEVEYIFRQLT